MKTTNEIKTWKEAEGWAEEVIHQEKIKKQRWRAAWAVTFAALVVTNIYWICK